MADLDLRLVMLFVWGGGIVVVYAKGLSDSYGDWQEYRDQRSKRELMVDFGLFLTALASAVAVALVLFGPAGTGIRAFSTTVALGAFLGAGIVKASTRGKRIDL